MSRAIAAEDLPPYDSQGSCPKCGETDVSTTYHCGFATGKNKATGENWPCNRSGISIVSGEHLCRVCQRCGYGRAEQVKTPEDET
jgi:hypothetical protein